MVTALPRVLNAGAVSRGLCANSLRSHQPAHWRSLSNQPRRSLERCQKLRAEADRDQVKGTGTKRDRNRGDRSRVTPESARELLDELLDPKAFGKRGEGWFAAQTVVLLLVIFPPGQLRQVVDVFGWVLVLCGLALIIAASIDLGTNLTPVPRPRDSNHTLVTDGMYQLCRHPMYGGLLMGAAGLSLATGDEAKVALTLLLYIVLDRKSAYEESLLEERYPGQYAEYKTKVKKFVPYVL